MKKLILFWTFAVLTVFSSFAGKAKYVFYFIGDGMGVNQVQAAEYYLGELDGKIGIHPLLYPSFAHASLVTTYSATNGVTDSAAGGTALATGHKTKNGALGLTADLKTEINSIAVDFKKAGMQVGIATTVSVDHATPAAFYAHVPSRQQYYKIGEQLCSSGFDFFAGSDFLDPTDKKNGGRADLYRMARDNGYVIARGVNDFKKQLASASKMILLQSEAASKAARDCVPYAIDRREGDGSLTLPEITESAISFLTKDNSKGFFLMVEGGKIDWACHSNDAATAIHEVIDFNNAIRVAYDFYKQHPDETLIVISADHETGGIVLGKGPYELNLKALSNQKVSEYGFTKIVNRMRQDTGNKVTWEMMRKALEDNFGFWKTLKLTDKQEARLKSVFESSFTGKTVKLEKSEYQQDEPIATEAKRIISEIALVGWTSGGHSAGYVPVYAEGVGAELFTKRIDNTEIPTKILEVAGLVTANHE